MTKPFVIICGAPKLGKSTEVFKTFQDSLAILSSVNNPFYFKKLLTTRYKNPIVRTVAGIERTFIYKAPRRIKLIDTHSTNIPKESEPYSWDIKPKSTKGKWVQSDTGNVLVQDPEGTVLMPVRQVDELEKTIISVVAQSLDAVQKGGPPPYDNIIIDEWGEFMDRVYSEILPTCLTKKGEINPLEAYSVTGEWMAKVINWLKQLIACNVGVAVVCHDRDPGTTQKGEMRPGGPKAPSAGMAYRMVGMSDGAIQRYMKDPEYGAKDANGKPAKPKRLWRLTATEQWNVGLRGVEPEDEELCAEKELYDVLVEYAGYEL